MANGDDGKFGGYRFIPLEDNLTIDAPIAYDQIDHTNARKRLSGYIDVTWKNYTPLCVGENTEDADTPEQGEEIQAEEGSESSAPKGVSKPFKLGDKLAIPGASLRGMLRAVVEIASFSHLWRINAKRRYGFRDFSAYHRKMYEGMKAGWLVYKNNEDKWYLYNAKENRNNILYYSDNIKNLTVPATAINDWIFMTISQKYKLIINGQKEIKRDYYVKDTSFNIGGTCVERHFAYLFDSATHGDHEKTSGYIVCSGEVLENQANKLYETVFGIKDDDSISRILTDDDMFKLSAMYSRYKSGGRLQPVKNSIWSFWLKQKGYPEPTGGGLPDDEVEIIKELRDYPGIPVFFVDAGNGDKRLFAISLTRSFKYPYFHSVGEIANRSYGIPSEQRFAAPPLNVQVDFARAIFGDIDQEAGGISGGKAPKANLLKGRVFFEFARHCQGNGNETDIHHIQLEEPRPSYLPHYMSKVQVNKGTYKESEEIVDYSDYGINWKWKETKNGQRRDFVPIYRGGQARIAGRKRYPVRSAHVQGSYDTWPLNDLGKRFQNVSQVKFVKKDNIFEGRIIFRHLTDVELGALLWALRFGESLVEVGDPKFRHALGRAKALGFGSVGVVKASLYLDKRCLPVNQHKSDDGVYVAMKDEMTTCMNKFSDDMKNKMAEFNKQIKYYQFDEWNKCLQIKLLINMADPTIAENNTIKKGLMKIEIIKTYNRRRRERVVSECVPPSYVIVSDK